MTLLVAIDRIKNKSNKIEKISKVLFRNCLCVLRFLCFPRLYQSDWAVFWVLICMVHLNLTHLTHLLQKQGVPWHSGNYRVWIHSETRKWHNNNIQLYQSIQQRFLQILHVIVFLRLGFVKAFITRLKAFHKERKFLTFHRLLNKFFRDQLMMKHLYMDCWKVWHHPF